jgi:hypothetical protein
MKNIQLIRVIVLLFSLIVFNSCDQAVEPIDPALINNLGNQEGDCQSPESVNGAFSSATSITISWSQANNETSWQIQYGPAGFALGAGTIISSTSTSRVINGLQAATSYDFLIRSVCSATEFGEWSEPFTVTPPNPNCSTPSGLTVVRNPGNSTATVNWTAGGTETSWQVLYVPAGLSIGQGTTLTATSKPFTVSNLTNDSYDFYVRAKCSATETSSWSPLKNLAAVSITPSGDYWPMTINNSWTYKKDGIIQEPMKIISSETMNGNLYYRYDNFFGLSNLGTGFSATAWTRKANGSYYYKVNAASTTFTVTIPELIIFKDNLNVNQTWNESVTQITNVSGMNIESQVTTVGKILEKNISLTINGTVYNNVIKSELIKTTAVQGSSNQVDKNTYWFASGVGPIKIINEINGSTITQELNSKVIN